MKIICSHSLQFKYLQLLNKKLSAPHSTDYSAGTQIILLRLHRSIQITPHIPMLHTDYPVQITRITHCSWQITSDYSPYTGSVVQPSLQTSGLFSVVLRCNRIQISGDFNIDDSSDAFANDFLKILFW